MSNTPMTLNLDEINVYVVRQEVPDEPVVATHVPTRSCSPASLCGTNPIISDSSRPAIGMPLMRAGNRHDAEAEATRKGFR